MFYLQGIVQAYKLVHCNVFLRSMFQVRVGTKSANSTKRRLFLLKAGAINSEKPLIIYFLRGNQFGHNRK